MSGTTNPDHTHNPGGNGRPSGVVPACGHTHQNTVKQDNSCTTSGSVVTYCTDCNTVVTSQVIAASGHSYVMGICQTCKAQDPSVYTNDYNNYYIVGNSGK
jgi:membrane-bound inhibitor of C-type lysozyme